MSSRLLTFAITAAIMLAGTLVVLREGWLSGWQMRIKEMMATSGPPYTPARFRIDLVDQVNYARTADRMAPLKVDPEMEAWLTKHYPTLDLADLDAGDAHRRTRGQSGHVGELRLERVPLPGEALRAGQAEDEDGADRDGHHRQHADLQFRPRQ